MGEQGETLVVALCAALFVVVTIWLLTGPNRRRTADLERRLDESKLELMKSTSQPLVSDDETDHDVRLAEADRRPDANVIELHPKFDADTDEHEDAALERNAELAHELAVTREEVVRWRGLSDDFERRWRHEKVSVERLGAEVDQLRATEQETRRSIDEIRTRLVELSPALGDALNEPQVPDPDVPDPEVIDLRDRRSDLEDRLTQLAAEIDDVRRDLAAEEE